MAAGAMGKAYDATWGRLFASLYDRALKASEENGLVEMRRALLAEARGRVVEIGAGTGVNLDLYGPEIEDLTLIEPDPHMGARLRERLVSPAHGAASAAAASHRVAAAPPASASAAARPAPSTDAAPGATASPPARLVTAPAEALP